MTRGPIIALIVTGAVLLAAAVYWTVRRIRRISPEFRQSWPTIWYRLRWSVVCAVVLAVAVGASVPLVKYIRLVYPLWAYIVTLCVVGAVTVPVSVVFIIYAFKPLWIVRRIKQYNAGIQNRGSVQVTEGAPGTGKTLSITNDAYWLSQNVFGDKWFEYLVGCARLNHKNEECRFQSDDEIQHFQSVCEMGSSITAHTGSLCPN